MTDVLERVKTYQQFINGAWVDSASGETIDVENPADGKVIAKVQGSSPEDVDRAANAAAKAFETWGKTTPQERSQALLKLADAIEARADELGRLESKNAGKPVAVAIDEIPVVVDNLRFFAGAARACSRARPPTSTWPTTPRSSAASRSASSPRSRRGTTRS